MKDGGHEGFSSLSKRKVGSNMKLRILFALATLVASSVFAATNRPCSPSPSVTCSTSPPLPPKPGPKPGPGPIPIPIPIYR
jgi:hypothetical protein